MMPNATSAPNEDECLSNQSELEKQISLLTSQISDIQHELDEKKRQNQELQTKMFEIQKQSALSKQKLVSLNQQLIQRNKQITNDNEKRQHEYYNLFTTMNQLQKAFDKAQKQNEQQKIEYERLLKQSEEKIAKLSEENDRLTIESHVSSSHQTESHLIDYEKTMRILQEENSELLNQNSKYLQAITKLKIALKKRNMRMEARSQLLRKENAQLKKKLRSSASRVPQLLVRISESENESLRLRALLAAREAEIKACRDDIDEAKYVIHKMRAGADECPLQDIEQMEDVIRVLQLKCEDLENVNHRLFMERNELKRSNARFKRMNDELLAKQKNEQSQCD